MSNYTARFSGHQTFPLRYGWLYKFVQSSLDPSFESSDVESLMIDWGVGKNMVDAIKYWANQSGADVNDKTDEYYTSIHAKDAFMEQIDSVWLLHWFLCRNFNELSSIKIFFNFYNGLKTDRDTFAEFIKQLFSKKNFEADTKSKNLLKLPSDSTLKKDVGVLFLMYSSFASARVSEDSFSSPLAELGLIRALDKSTFVCELEERATLSDAVFTYSLVDYFMKLKEEMGTLTTFAFDTFLMSEGSPARIFRMSQSEVEKRLDEVSKLTEGKIGWTDTQGLRQIQIKDDAVLTADYKQSLLRNIYK